MSVRTIVAGLAVAALVGGCAGARSYPEPKTAAAQSAIGGAQALGAEREPRAALHLKLAREQLATAEELIDDGEDDDAYLVLGRAEADARLAQALARDAALQRRAAQASQRVRDLRR